MVLYQASSSGPLGVEQLPPPTDDDELLWPLTASGDDFRMDRIVVVGLQELEWEQLTARMAKGPVTVRITGRDMTDRMASFSSRGPTSDYALEPDIVAPGVEIRSAWPTRQWEPGVFRLSGTSMSSPHVAGAAALLRQLDPDAAVERINGRLVGSARLLEDAAPSAQGTGRLDVAAAVRQTVTASPTSLSFGLADTSRNTLRAERKVTLHNDGRKPVLLRLQARPSEQSTGHVVVTPGALVVPPGKSRTATVRLTGRTPDDRAELSGWVEARPIGSSTPVVRVPYLLSVVPVIVQASPDPGPDGTTLLIGTPYDVTAPPVVTVRPPRGKPQTIRAVHDHGTWWRAEYRSDVEGTHEATVRAVTELGPTVTGTGRFEVVPPAPDGVGSWEPVGPNAQAGWIAETPADPDTIALHAYGSLSPWLSTDDGDTWRQVPSLPVADGEGTIVVDPNDARQMWFAVSGYAGAVTFDPTYQGAILHSTDAGRSWRRLAAPDVRYETLVTDTRGRVLVAVTESALQVSRDDGASWQAVPNPAGAGVADVGFSGDDLFVSSSRQVWRVPGLAAGEPGTAHVVYSDEGALRGMAVGDAAVAILDSDEAVEVSTDRGETWEHRYQGPSLGPWDLLMVDDDLVLTTYSGHSFIGRDLGTSWRQVTHPVPGAIPTDVTRRGDGLLWAQQNIGMNLGDPETGELRDRIGVQGHTAYDVEVTSAGELLAGTQLGIYDTEVPTGKVTPDTAEWGLSGGEARSGRSVPLITESSDGSVLWSVHPTTFSAFDVKRSTDGGDTWQTHGRTPGGAHALAVDTRDPDTVAVAFSVVDGAGVHVTRDGGATWRKMFHGRFRALEADPQVHGRLWLGGDEGLFVSDDFGVTLRKVRAGAVTAIDRHGKRLVVAGPDGIAVSTDRGRSFKDARDGDLPTDVTDLVTSPTNDRLLFAGTRKHVANGVVKNGRGVLMSRDGGRSWTNVSRGLQNTSVVSLDMTDDGRWLFAGTTDGGVHRMRVTGR